MLYSLAVAGVTELEFSLVIVLPPPTQEYPMAKLIVT